MFCAAPFPRDIFSVTACLTAIIRRTSSHFVIPSSARCRLHLLDYTFVSQAAFKTASSVQSSFPVTCRRSLRKIAIATARFLPLITHVLFDSAAPDHYSLLLRAKHCYCHCHCCHQINKLGRSCANRIHRLSSQTTRTITSPSRRHRSSFYLLPPSALCFFIQSSKPSSVLDTPN